MAMITDKKKAILKKILAIYDNDYKKVLLQRKKEIFQCEMLKNYKKVRIDNYKK
ncbi:MAG: hypothetical protein WCQ76_06140 [Fusobacterium sp.]